jgi:hypothetical protein
LAKPSEKKKAGVPPRPPAQEPAEGTENLEKVRDLLFGTQLRTVDTRFGRMEERITREIVDLRDEVRKRIDSLEMFVKKELETLVAGINSEQEKRSEADGELKADLGEAVETFEKRSSQTDRKIEQTAKDIREQLLAQTKNLTDDILRKHEEALKTLKDSAESIRTEYVDRSNLSQMFTDLALRLDTSLAGALLSDRESKDDE